MPRMTVKALEALEKALTSGDFSEGWRHECTNHPKVLEGTTGFEVKACPKYKDFVASLYLGSTSKGAVLTIDVAIEKVDTGYEGQMLKDDAHVRLVSYRVPTWSWAWGGISVLVGDAKARETEPLDEEEEFEEEECECIPEKKMLTLDKWFA